MTHFIALLVFLAGLYGVVNGVNVEQNAAGAIHQVYGAIYVTGGVLAVGLSGIIEAILMLNRAQKARCIATARLTAAQAASKKVAE